MAPYKKQLFAALTVGVIAVASLAYISRTPSATADLPDKVRVVESPRPPGQWAINAAYGRGALSNLRAAFVELENHNSEQARMGMVVARSLLTKIAPVPPHSSGETINEAIGSEAMGASAFVLIHSEVRVPDGIGREADIESKLDGIRRDIDMNNSDDVLEALRELNVPLTYTRVDLPLQETIDGIDHALEALNSDDVERASAMLAEIGNGLRIDTVQIDSHESQLSTPSNDDAG